jgi:hypothetical protein
MSSNVVNKSPYLQESKEFPEDQSQLLPQLTSSYVETAKAVNDRTIGVYPTNRPAITGDSYFYNKNQKQQSLRQIYHFIAPIAASYPHGIKPQSINHFSPNTYGEYKSGSNYYGAIFGSSTAIPDQVSFYIDGTANTIVILQGLGAPVIDEIIILLEWISTI